MSRIYILKNSNFKYRLFNNMFYHIQYIHTTDKSLLFSPRLHLFNQKYKKNPEIL